MAVKVVLLGRLADLADGGEMNFAGPLDWQGLLSLLPDTLSKAVQESRTKIALNGEVLFDKTALSAVDGDELALLPPVSGG